MSTGPWSVEVGYRIGGAADLRVIVQDLGRQKLLQDLPEIDRVQVATIVSELGGNIVKYAGRGEIRVCRAERSDAVDVDIWAEDHGPGIDNIEHAMTDRFSTGGTLGLGLPGVRRMADEFWIRSEKGQGTLVFARKTLGRRMHTPRPPQAGPVRAQAPKMEGGQLAHFDYSIAARPYPGNPFTGDAACVVSDGKGWLVAMIDASGHGRGASIVAHTVLEIVHQFKGGSLELVFQQVHARLKGTTGAAMGLLYLNPDTATLQYAAIGNTRFAKFSGKSIWVGIARDGVLGNRLPTLQVHEAPLRAGDLLLLWSDGIPDYEARKMVEQLASKEPEQVASMLVQQLAKPYDDACCLALRWT